MRLLVMSPSSSQTEELETRARGAVTALEPLGLTRMGECEVLGEGDTILQTLLALGTRPR